MKDEKRPDDFKIDIQDKIKDIPEYSYVATKNKKNTNPFLKIMIGLIIVGIAVLISLVILFGVRDMFGINNSTQEIKIDISQNANATTIAKTLQDNGIIDSAFFFRSYIKLKDIPTSFHYGTYTLTPDMSYDTIIAELNKYSKSNEEVKVTFPEGKTIYEMSKILEQNGVCSADDFITALDSDVYEYDFIDEIEDDELIFHKLEGYLFPDTYFFYKNDNPVNVVNKMLSNFNKKITPEMKKQMDELGFTLSQTMNIASIVQKEAGKTSEMKKVASVYFNRLTNKGVYPNLQACPTRDYANQLKLQMDIIDRTIIDAYNTYEQAGLPPGAICNPGIDAINATLNPDNTDYYFFCTNLKTGEFYYGKTLKEHEKNIFKAGLL